MRRMRSDEHQRADARVHDPVDDFEHDPNAVRRRSFDGVQVYEINRPFFFGPPRMFKDRVAHPGKPKCDRAAAACARDRLDRPARAARG